MATVSGASTDPGYAIERALGGGAEAPCSAGGAPGRCSFSRLPPLPPSRPSGMTASSATWPADAAEDPRWRWLDHLAARGSEATRVGELASGFTLAAVLRAAGFTNVEIERYAVDLGYTDAENWLRWSWAHGFRAVLERLSPEALDRLVQVAGPRLEATREADGLCHRRLTALFGYGRVHVRSTGSRGADPAVRRRRYGDDRPAARPVVA